jgi:hypothetical protein
MLGTIMRKIFGPERKKERNEQKDARNILRKFVTLHIHSVPPPPPADLKHNKTSHESLATTEPNI